MKEIDDLLEDDLFLEDPSEDPKKLEGEPEPIDDFDYFEENDDNEKPSDLISSLLKEKGIVNNKITIIDENDEEKEVDFFSLPLEEQLQIISDTTDNSTDNLKLEDEERKFLSELRKSNTTLESFLESYKDDILKNNIVNSSYEIDDYSDEELFLMDLKTKFDLTDEELSAELDKELEKKDIFDKKVKKLRDEYKQLEDDYKRQQEQAFNTEKEEKYNKFVDTMVNVAIQNTDLYGIELEDSEKNEVLSFILELDDKGTSEFYKNLNDPKKLYEAA